MGVEQAEAGADDGLTIAPRIPGDGQTRRDVVGIERNSLLDVEGVLRCGVERIGCGATRVPLKVVTEPVVHGQLAADLPAVLPKNAEGGVVEGVVRVSNSLNEFLR